MVAHVAFCSDIESNDGDDNFGDWDYHQANEDVSDNDPEETESLVLEILSLFSLLEQPIPHLVCRQEIHLKNSVD